MSFANVYANFYQSHKAHRLYELITEWLCRWICVGCYVATLCVGYGYAREGHISLTTFIMFTKVTGRGLHSFTFQLKVSASCGIWGAFKGCLDGAGGA